MRDDAESTPIGVPIIDPAGNGYKIKYENQGIEVYCRSISRDRGNLIAEVDLQGPRRIGFKELLGYKLSLQSFSVRKKSADELTKSSIYNEPQNIPFHELFEDLAGRLIKLYRNGNSIEESVPLENIVPVKYVIEPFIYEDNPTIIFGGRGIGKSLLAEFLDIVATLPWQTNPLGLIIPSTKSLKVLYLDYERSKLLFDMRLTQLVNGHNLDFVPLNYMRCWQPLADIVDRIEATKVELGIDLLIIDSLGQATGGNINEAEPAIRYFGALRSLNLPSLTLAQTAKDTMGRQSSVFGSAYFEYYASSIWEAHAEIRPSELIMSLKNTKCNISAPSESIGIKFSFTAKENNPKIIEKIQVSSMSKTDIGKTELISELPVKDRIHALLLQTGKMKIPAIAGAIEENQDTTRTKLYQYQGKLFVKMGDEWGAIAKG